MPGTKISALVDAATRLLEGATKATRNTAALTPDILQNGIIASATFAIVATDGDGVVQLFNVGAERLFGWSAAEMVGTAAVTALHDPQELAARAAALGLELDTAPPSSFATLTHNAARGVADTYQALLVRRDDTRIPARMAVTPLYGSEARLVGYLFIGADTPNGDSLEAELAKARVAALQASVAKADFLSGMSHEMRSPLNAILGFAQLLEAEPEGLTAMHKACTEQIVKAGWHLLELINEILDLSLIDAGRLAVSQEPLALDEVLLDCHATIAPLAQQHDIALNFGAVPSPCFVSGDRTRVKQALMNLMSNAIKYNQPGGEVSVQCMVMSEYIRINVTDTGAGLSAENMALLFQPFTTVASTAVGKEVIGGKGAGIGLAMAQRLVELMGGNIGVQSNVGEGSTFWIELLRAAEPKAEEFRSSPALAGSPAPSPQPPKPRTLLYVEDNPANLKLVEQLVSRRADLRLLSAEDATLGIVLARGHQPDVILMDINLPGINGVKALRILREDPRTRHIPVVAVTGNNTPNHVSRGLAAGFFGYVTKPIKDKHFMDTLDAALIHAANRTTQGIGAGSPQDGSHAPRR